MNRLAKLSHSKVARKRRVRAVVSGTPDRPRLSVHISNRHVVAQIIDDSASKTLAFTTTVGAKATGKNMTEKAAWAGSHIAAKAKSAKVTKVSFDRGGRIYHGRVKALADAAREAGLEF